MTNEKTFRDLSKPMGAQTEYRLKQFQERFRSWEDPQNKTPPYYYGTHYSSAMIVASYLIRLEPFTEQFLRLQVMCSLLSWYYALENLTISLTIKSNIVNDI